MKYKIGTRGSKLALKQTNDVIHRLKQAYPEDEFEAVSRQRQKKVLPLQRHGKDRMQEMYLYSVRQSH